MKDRWQEGRNEEGILIRGACNRIASSEKVANDLALSCVSPGVRDPFGR